MEKKYVVVRFYYCGLIGIQTEMSRHSTTKAAWRAYHKYVNQFGEDEDTHYYVVNSEGRKLIEVKRRNDKGRWETL